MPKLLKKNFPIIASSLLILLVIALAVYYFVGYDSGNSPKLKQGETYTLFNGEVKGIIPESQEISIKSGNDGKSYLVKLESGGTVLLNSEPSTFSEIKVGDQVNVYSSKYKQKENRELPAEKIIIVRATDEILKQITN